MNFALLGTWSKRRLPNVPLMLQLFVFVSQERLNSLNIKVRVAGSTKMKDKYPLKNRQQLGMR